MPNSQLARQPDLSSSDVPYIKLPLAAFRMQLVENIDLYCMPPDLGTTVLYRSASYPLRDSDIEELQRRGHEALYVSPAEFADVQRDLFRNLESIVDDERYSPEERFSVLQAAVAFEVDVAYRLIRPTQFVTVARRLATNIATLLEENHIVPRSLFDIVQHDYYTFTHVTNVAGFAVLLAERLGITDRDQLRLIAEGAMLHDAGKRFIPTAVLCKPKRLTEEERHLMETHPLRGFVDLKKSSDLGHDELMMVYQHHERVDGRGYPVRILGDEIHPWAKLLAVVDVFDAVTSRRPYRDPMPLGRALNLLEQCAGTHFEREIVRCWVSALQEQ